MKIFERDKSRSPLPLQKKDPGEGRVRGKVLASLPHPNLLPLKKEKGTFRNSCMVLGIIFFCVLGCDTGPSVSWEKFEERRLDQAQRSGKPTLAYFYAAWCRPCQQLRSSTFRNAEVIAALENWNRFKADMSFREDTLTISRTKHFEVWGLPTLIFYDAAGQQVQKTIGFVSAQSLIETIRAIEAKTVNVL